MKMQLGLSKSIVFIALLSMLGVLPVRAQAMPEVNLVAVEIQKIAPAVFAIEDKIERDGTLALLAIALARIGNFEAALRLNNEFAGARQIPTRSGRAFCCYYFDPSDAVIAKSIT